MVIYTDSNPKYQPDSYHYKVAGTELNFFFGTYKVLDQSEEALEKSDNPFALVILTVLESIKMNNKPPEQQIDIKMNLVRRLIEKDYDHKYIRDMMNFIRFYVTLTDEQMNLKFEKRVEELVTNKNIPMGVEEILLQQAEERGLQKGREEHLYEVVKKLIVRGKSNQEICDLLEVSEAYVQTIRKEFMG